MSLDLNSTVLDLIKAVNKASSVPVATSSALGGIKIGYSASGANIPIELSNENQSAYVELTEAAITEALGYVPLNDESISITSTLTSGTEIGSIKVGDTTTKLYAPTATAAPIGDVLEVGTIKIDGETNKLENIDSPNNNIYIGDDSVDIESPQLYLRGETCVAAQGYIELLAGQDTGTYITLNTVYEDDRRIDISSDYTAIYGEKNLGLGIGENDEAFISAYLEDDGSGSIDIGAREIRINGNVTVNGSPIGSGGGGSSGGWRQVTFDEFKTSCDIGTIVRLVPAPDGDSNFESADTKFKNLGLQIVCGDGGYFCVRNTELETYLTDETQLCFSTYEILRDEDDFIYASIFTTVFHGSSDSNEHRKYVYELDDSNCEFYIWEG